LFYPRHLPRLWVAAALLVLGCVAVVVIVSVRQGRVNERSQKSASQIRGIGQALILWAENNRRDLPSPEEDWVGLLTQSQFAPTEMFISPDATDTKTISYFYVPGVQPFASPERVLVYEMPGLRHDGVWILYGDMAVDLVASDEAERIIATLTLPDGTPWQPHLSPRKAP
jgi:hypothetical protein